jgi:hypothetical protein
MIIDLARTLLLLFLVVGGDCYEDELLYLLIVLFPLLPLLIMLILVSVPLLLLPLPLPLPPSVFNSNILVVTLERSMPYSRLLLSNSDGVSLYSIDAMVCCCIVAD